MRVFKPSSPVSLQVAGLVADISDPTSLGTVFAPTDAAFTADLPFIGVSTDQASLTANKALIALVSEEVQVRVLRPQVLQVPTPQLLPEQHPASVRTHEVPFQQLQHSHPLDQSCALPWQFDQTTFLPTC